MASVSVLDMIGPNDRQREFLMKLIGYLEGTNPEKYLLYGGAKGGGKSYLLRWAAAMLPIYWFQTLGARNVRTGLFCQTYDDLRDMHITKVKYELPSGPGGLGDWHEQSREFRLHAKFGGGIVAFRNLKDPSEYNGKEFGAVLVDELTSQPEQTFHDLRSCLRWPGIEKNPFLAGTNPGGMGHAWTKKLFVTRDFSPPHDMLKPEEFGFVQAFASDNPKLPESYYETLASLPESMRRRYLEGDWDVFEGQFFNEWRPNLHVVAPFEIPTAWKRWRSLDHGATAPTCCLWYAQDPDSGRTYVYREYYRPGLTAQANAERIYELSGDEEYQYTAADPSMWQKSGVVSKGERMTCPADIYLENGVPLRRAVNDRVPGANNVREALALRPDGLPRLQIFSTCRNLQREIPLLLHSEKNPEDVEVGTHISDHAYDALRYGLSLVTVHGREYKKPQPAYGQRRYA